MSIVFDFFWAWFYLRLFMRSNTHQIGDLSQEFAIFNFFPKRLQAPIIAMSDFTFAVFNMCGFVNYVRRYPEGKSLTEPKHQKVPTEDAESDSSKKVEKKAGSEERKKKAALEFLDEEIE